MTKASHSYTYTYIYISYSSSSSIIHHHQLPLTQTMRLYPHFLPQFRLLLAFLEFISFLVVKIEIEAHH